MENDGNKGCENGGREEFIFVAVLIANLLNNDNTRLKVSELYCAINSHANGIRVNKDLNYRVKHGWVGQSRRRVSLTTEIYVH